MQRYLDRQTKLFSVLLNDLKHEKLRVGMTKIKFIKTYGEPIFSRKFEDGTNEELLFYRHPTKYFDSQKVYLFFDNSGKLIRWECNPFKQNNPIEK